jgi:hypothetical protein
MAPIYSKQFATNSRGVLESLHSRLYVCMFSGRLHMQSSVRRNRVSEGTCRRADLLTVLLSFHLRSETRFHQPSSPSLTVFIGIRMTQVNSAPGECGGLSLLFSIWSFVGCFPESRQADVDEGEGRW